MIRTAVLDGVYRYSLTRQWGRGPRILWIMLNPSRADASVDDPTIRRCIGFSCAWGFSAMEVVNLYALRASDPGLLRRHNDPVGPDNDAQILRSSRRANVLIAAWGAFPWATARIEAVEELLSAPLLCLGRTREGFPKHPLYVRRDTPLIEFGATPSSPGTRSPRRAPHPSPRASPSPLARPRCRV